MLLVAFFGYAVTHQQPVSSNSGYATVGGLPLTLNNLTNTSATATPVSSIILATSTARQYVAIVNSSSTDVYLSLGPTAFVGRGILLKAGGSYEILEENLYTGAISAIVAAGATTTLSMSYKQ